jgi:hypothetical protein
MMHLVREFDGPFLCNGSHDGVWTYDEEQATCVPCLRAAVRAAPREDDPRDAAVQLRARLARALSSLASMREWHAVYHGKDPCALCVDADGVLTREGVEMRSPCHKCGGTGVVTSPGGTRWCSACDKSGLEPALRSLDAARDPADGKESK